MRVPRGACDIRITGIPKTGRVFTNPSGDIDDSARLQAMPMVGAGLFPGSPEPGPSSGHGVRGNWFGSVTSKTGVGFLCGVF